MERFDILPVDTGVRLIRAWADHSWPITQDEAFALRDGLGWKPFPDAPHLFTTEVGLDPGEGFMNVDDGVLSNLNFELSALAAASAPGMATRTRNALDEYATALSSAWGTPRRSKRRGVNSADWTIPNGSYITIKEVDGLLTVFVQSPEWQVTKAMARLDEIETGDA